MDNVVDAYAYLRKSRKDLEEEKRQADLGNEYDTLERHRSQLQELAKINKINIIAEFQEVESGEFISERPEMQTMLRQVENDMVDAVLCMDLDRLGRGDMVDQGTIYRILKNSDTVIITPSEIINPADENQELTFSIKSLIAREELKSIVKRMQRGRKQSSREGKSISKKPAYGYCRDENLKLYPDPETKSVVEMIFTKAANGMGIRTIAEELDRLHIKPPASDHWERSSIGSIIQNEVYLGTIIWGKVKSTKINGKYTRKKVPREQWTITENAHEAIITEELFNKTNAAMHARWRPHLKNNYKLTNPLAGLLYCENCGKAMTLQPRPNRPSGAIRCNNHICKGIQKGCNFPLVEQQILITLEKMINQFELPEYEKKKTKSSIKLKEKALNKIIKEKEEVDQQNDNIHDLLEKGIYDIKTFQARQQIIKSKLDDLDKKITDVQEEINKELSQQTANNEYIPRVKSVLEAYRSTDDVEKKNKLLKSVIERVTYLRRLEWTKKGEFEIKLYTKI